MELFALLICLFFLVTLFMPWVNHFRFGPVREHLERLESKIRQLEDRLDGKVQKPSAFSQASTTDIVKDDNTHIQKAREAERERIQKLLEVQRQKDAEIFQQEIQAKVENRPTYKTEVKSDYSFEKNIATKLPVWIGAISLICAAFFLVKYSIELGWLSPLVRISIGGVFGAALVTAGQWIVKRPNIANSTRIAQGLVGAGLVALYVSLYAAINLYHLLPPLLGFGGMTAITALAVILSLRHGQPIAVFGLLGGLLTPALVGSTEPNAIAMFTYLFLLFSGMFIVLARKGWWILAVAALLGVFGWSVCWFMIAFAATDAFVLVLFAIAITAVVLAVTGKHVAENNTNSRSIHVVNLTALAGGILTITWLSFKISLTLFDWSMLGLLSVALMALAYFQPAVYQRPLWVKLGANLILFAIWAQHAPLNDAIAVIVGMSVIYVGGGALIMRQVNDPRFWAGLQAIAAIALYVISYRVLNLPAGFIESFGMFWGILSLILASLAIYQASDIRAKYTADGVIQEHLVAIYALAASAFISLGIAIELPWQYVPLAIAGQITATAWIYQKTGIDFLKKIMIILIAVFAAMNYELIVLFANLMLHSIAGESPGIGPIGSRLLAAPLVKLGAPTVLVSLALWATMQRDRSDQKTIRVLFGAAGLLALATFYTMLRIAIHANDPGFNTNIFAISAGFIERGIITVVFAALGAALLHASNRPDMAFLTKSGKALFHLAMLRLAYFDLLLFNPLWARSQFVGDTPLLNGITLTFGLGALLTIWAVRSEKLNSDNGPLNFIYKIFGFVMLFAFSSFTVRQYFHGGNMFHGSISAEELYSYSVVWLVTGLSLLAIGIHWANKSARMASLVFVVLAVLKVFLYDAAELEGLYRVFSFLGLGVSLIGLSFFYTKFVFKSARIQQAE